MVRMICNTCHKEEAPDNSLPPTGWFVIWRRRGDMGDTHVCSPACGLALFQQVQAEDDKVAAAKAALAAKLAEATDTVKLQLAPTDPLRLQ